MNQSRLPALAAWRNDWPVNSTVTPAMEIAWGQVTV